MDIDQKELFVNQYPRYIANRSHETYEEARKGCDNDPKVKTIKFVRAPEDQQVSENIVEVPVPEQVEKV
jgi:hypothetical protein